MKIKYYKTEWENDREPERRCCFEMLSVLIDNDVPNHPGLRPRLMHIDTRYFHTNCWAVAIVVWEAS